MPVVALPPNNTERWWLDYTVNGDTHSWLMRTEDDADPLVVSDVFGDLINNFTDASFYSWSALGLRRALRGSDVTLPFTFTGTPPSFTGTAVSTDDRAKQLSITGRDLSGHKARFFLFGAKLVSNGDYRTITAESAEVAAFLAALSATPTFFLSINGLSVSWHPYVNIGWNDHWVKQARP